MIEKVYLSDGLKDDGIEIRFSMKYLTGLLGRTFRIDCIGIDGTGAYIGVTEDES